MTKQTIIVKLGGSIVTAKHRTIPTIRRTLVKKIGSVLAKGYDPKKHIIILIHGGGSFGHLHAAKHGLRYGAKDHPEKIPLALEHQQLDQKLNTEITKLLLESGLPVASVVTHSVAINRAGKLKSLDMKSTRATLATGSIPLLYGDMIFDETWGLSILSGDVLVARLAEELGAANVFFTSDIDGIFTADPHQDKNAALIRETTLRDIRSGMLRLGQSHNVDVTGGLSEKFSLFRQDSHRLKNIFLFNGFDPTNFHFVFDQKNFFGTKISC